MEISELLLSVDVDVDYADEMGRTFTMKQIVKDFTDEMVKITKFLIKEKHSNVNKTDIEGWNIVSIFFLLVHNVKKKVFGD